MSETNTDACSSELKDNSASQAKRYAHGSDIVNELMLWLEQQIIDADGVLEHGLYNDDLVEAKLALREKEAYRDTAFQLKALMSERDDICEGTKPNA